MIRILLAAALTVVAAPLFAADVGVSISIGEPGFYGRIEIGNAPRPDVIFSKPVIAHKAPSRQQVEPIYLRVPPGHEKHWHKHCRKYNACGRPVYFVKDTWYKKRYSSRHHEHEGKGNRDHKRDEHRNDHHNKRDKQHHHE